MEQLPGPSMAIAAPMQMRSSPARGSSLLLKTIDASRSTARIPATGVHSPMISRPPGSVEASASRLVFRNPAAAMAEIPFVSR